MHNDAELESDDLIAIFERLLACSLAHEWSSTACFHCCWKSKYDGMIWIAMYMTAS
jgi:hypothetical protein